MKKKVVHRLPITTTHTTPICRRATPKHEIIQSKNLTMSSCPEKESHSLRNLWFLNTLPKKQRILSSLNHMVERPGVKLSLMLKLTSMISSIMELPKEILFDSDNVIIAFPLPQPHARIYDVNHVSIYSRCETSSCQIKAYDCNVAKLGLEFGASGSTFT